jgi:putative ABC transport system substrate-binding protein
MERARKNMKRKITVFTLCAMLFALCASAEAQQPRKIPQVGFLSMGSVASMANRVDAFRRGLREQGYIEGQNIHVEYRYAEGDQNRLREFAAELVNLKVDVIVTGGTISTRSAKQATNTIPIIMAYDSNPVDSGIIASLARPGGNITGLASLTTDLSGKRLELLKQAVPKLSRVEVFLNPSDPSAATAAKELETVAKGLGVTVYPFEIRSAADIDKGFQAAMKIHAGALMAISDPITFTHRKRFADLAMKNRLPSIHAQIQFIDAGALMVYGPDESDMYRRTAKFVDKILKGAKPADLPVEQPTKFELVINLKTAKILGLTIPESFLLRADKVIE